jgi:predicted DNA binding CopG/RHH family protein
MGEVVAGKIKLTREERAIEDSLESFIPVDKQEYEQIINAIAARKRDAVLNIRVNSHDLASIKYKAQRLGIRYQTFISEVIHRIAQAN